MKWWTAIKEKVSIWYDNWKLERAYKKKLKILRKNDPFNYK
jgi:hypothetical protein